MEECVVAEVLDVVVEPWAGTGERKGLFEVLDVQHVLHCCAFASADL